jgi:hypothetical protein
MHNSKFYFFIVIICLSYFRLNAQVEQLEIKIDEESKIGEDIDKEKLEMSKKLLQQFLLNYQQYNTMVDLSFKDQEDAMVTSESQKKFVSLFSPIARVFNDLKEFPVHGTQNDYVDFIATYYRRGLDKNKLFLTSVHIDEMKYLSESKEYEVSLKVRKLLYTMISESGKEKNIKDGRLHDLIFTIILPEDFNLKATKILKIKGQEIEKRAKRKIGLEVSSGINSTLTKVEFNTLGNQEVHSKIINIGILGGLRYNIGLSQSKNRKLILGLRYSELRPNFSSDQIQFQTKTNLSLNLENRTEMILSKFTEKILIQQLEFELGYNIPIVNSWRFDFGLGVFIKPVYVINLSTKSKGTSIINEYFDNNKVPWCTLNGSETNFANHYNPSIFNAYFGLEPYYEVDLSHDARIRLRLSLSANYALTDWVKENPIKLENHIVANEILVNNISSSNLTLITSLKPHYVGVAFGLIYKFVK